MANAINISNGILILSENAITPNAAGLGCIPLPTISANYETPRSKPTKRKRKKYNVAFQENNPAHIYSTPLSYDDVAKALFVEEENHVNIKKSCPDRAAESLSEMDIDSSFNSENSKSGPNILKKHKKRGNNSTDDVLLMSDLDFSPSKFLNLTPLSSSLTTISCNPDLSFTSPSHKSLLHAHMSEVDSGIAMNASSDVESTFALPSLTSTPICSNSRKQILTPSKIRDEMASPDLKNRRDSFSISQIDMSFESQDINLGSSGMPVFKTPLIRRYLNETAPRTPTPFKCDTNSKSSQNTPISKTVRSIQDEYNSPVGSLHPRKLKDQLLCESSTKKARRHYEDNFVKSNKILEQKKARKSLLLEPEWKPCSNNRSFNNTDELATKLPPQENTNFEGFLALDSPFSKSQMKVRRLSGLIDNKTFVRQRTNSVLHKSIFYTSHKNNLDGQSEVKNNSMAKSWVTVACGRSKDQKDMTEAARRYLGATPQKSNMSLADVVTHRTAKNKIKYR